MTHREQQGINANDNSKVEIAQMVQNFAPPETRDNGETKLLNAVKNEVARRLAQSLHRRVYVELDKTEDPSQVTSPWSMDVKLGNRPSQRCPEGTHIVKIFDKPEIGGQLLILGAPGSGKTTLLLQLAEKLVQRGEENAKAPVPVLLNLSAWKTQYSDIPSWMVTDLKQKYGVRKDIAEAWINTGRILPLLDGLDELMSQRQDTCVQALNDFLPDWRGIPLVVCSRLEEYQVSKSNLELNGSVIVQPLTDGQIETYLRRAKCDWLWEAICRDVDIINPETGLARSPLFLSMLVLASDNLPPELWELDKNATERRRILFEAYIEARLSRPYRGGENYLVESKNGDRRWFKRKPMRNPYPNNERTKRWLGWFAARSIEDNQTELFIENLQPYFLRNRSHFFVYGVLFGIVFGLISCILIGFYVGLVGLIKWASIVFLIIGLVYGIFVGLILGLILGLMKGISFIVTEEPVRINTVETIGFSWRKIKEKVIKAIHDDEDLVLGLIGYIIFGLFCGIFFSLFFGLIQGFIIGLFPCLILGLIKELDRSPEELDELKKTKTITITFNLNQFKPHKFCKEIRKKTKTTYIIKMFTGLAFLFFLYSFFGVEILALGFIFDFTEKIVKKLSKEKVSTKISDNQGIFQSIKNSCIFGIILMPIGILIPNTLYLHYFDEFQLSVILISIAVIGFLLGASAGGLNSAIKHCALRITLWLFGYAPWNYSTFLRYCTDRGFLQRVGGGYRFVHALLRDHFAENYDPS